MRVYRNCCGLDVHKQTIAACVISENADGTSSRQKRIFGTMTQQLRELAQWLIAAKVTAVVLLAKLVFHKLLFMRLHWGKMTPLVSTVESLLADVVSTIYH